MSGFGMDYQGGGGFGASTTTATTTMQSSTQNNTEGNNANARPRKSYDEQTLIPVTCRMILMAREVEGGNVVLAGGRSLHQVQLVGAIRSVESLSTHVAYQVEDSTGLITVKLWIDDERPTTDQDNIEPHTYVKIVGTVKFYANIIQIMAHCVRPLQHSHEMVAHFLSVAFTGQRYLQRQQGQGALVQQQQQQQSFGENPAMPAGNTGVPLQQQAEGGGGDVNDHVLTFFKHASKGTDTGAPLDECIKQLALTGFTEAQVRAAVSELSSDGHIYSTIDDDHYQFAQ